MSSEPISELNDIELNAPVATHNRNSQSISCQQIVDSESEGQALDMGSKRRTEIDEKIQLDKGLQMNSPTVTLLSRQEALSSSETAARLQPQLPPYELSFWTDASQPGAKLTAKLKNAPGSGRGLVGFCVVHRRWDVKLLKPRDPHWVSTWWTSGFVATNIASVWQAEALGVLQALKMAVNHCEQVSGVIVNLNKQSRPCNKRIDAPMPKLINVFSDNAQVLKELGGMSDPNMSSRNRWLRSMAADLFMILSRHGVRVNLQWVPGHSSDIRNAWAHECARMALDPCRHHPKVYRKHTHRVMLKVRRDRRSLKAALKCSLKAE